MPICLIKSDRLSLQALCPEDAGFVLELLNTPGFLQFIGDRHVRTMADADAYVAKIMADTNIAYWMVRRKEDGVLIGTVTFIQRDYLKYRDIGYAFLPQFGGQGYAREAVAAVLKHYLETYREPFIMATVLASNAPSIRLLQRLGLRYESELKLDASEERDLHLYSVARGDLVQGLSQS